MLRIGYYDIRTFIEYHEGGLGYKEESNRPTAGRKKSKKGETKIEEEEEQKEQEEEGRNKRRRRRRRKHLTVCWLGGSSF